MAALYRNTINSMCKAMKRLELELGLGQVIFRNISVQISTFHLFFLPDFILMFFGLDFKAWKKKPAY